MKTGISILQVMTDPELFGNTFKPRLLRGDSWGNWKTFLRVLFGLPLDQEAKEMFARHTGRTDAPAQLFTEGFAIVGRRGGKSVIAALVATYLAAFKNYDHVLAPGEVGTLMVIAADRRQARVIFGYITAFLQLPMLRSMVISQLKESIELNNRTKIEIHTCSFKATRGYTLIGVIADELAFWNSADSANPDTEVLNALRPGLATTNGLLLGISSPYAKRGALFDAYRENYGKPTNVLVWKASSRDMNPTLDMATVAMAYTRDAAAARAEYGGQFRDDVKGFISREVVEARVVPGRFELPRVTGVTYTGFTDPSGGQADAMTLGICHVERGIGILDLLRESPAPFSPDQVCKEFADTLKRYGISTVVGDKYAGEWPREGFSKHGIHYRSAERTRSEIYLELLPAVMSGQVELLDSPRLVSQLVSLERRTARGGRDSIDHPPSGHDDLRNAAAGALVEVLGGNGELGLLKYFAGLLSGVYKEPEEPQLSPRSELLGKLEALRFEQRVLGVKPVNPQVSREETSPQCPLCRATCVTTVAGQFRCNQCSHQWWSDRSHRRTGPMYSRGDLARQDFAGHDGRNAFT